MPPSSVVATLTLDLHDTGALSISGNIGDVKCALAMLDAAREAVARQLGRPTILEPHGAGLTVPEIDVRAPHSPLYPALPAGDLK
jgi:hypothetical protein